MRKFLFAILTLFYLVISVGFINYNMFCQDQLMKTTVIMDNNSCEQCPNCSQEKCKKDGSCCKHLKEYVQLKTDQNHSLHHTNLTPQQSIILDIFLSGYILPDVYFVKKETHPFTNDPPLRAQSPIHILNCTYLI